MGLRDRLGIGRDVLAGGGRRALAERRRRGHGGEQRGTQSSLQCDFDGSDKCLFGS